MLSDPCIVKHQEQARVDAPEASLKRMEAVAEKIGLNEWAQCVKTFGAEGHPERSNLAQAFSKAFRGRKKSLILLCGCEKYEGYV